MKRWRETTQVLDRLAELRSEGKRAAVATVVRVRGSAYRREGAKLLVEEDGAIIGNVSGGCLEQDVREVALQVLASGVPQLKSYCSGADEITAWDLGVGCEGEVTVLVEPVADDRSAEMREQQRKLLRGDEPFIVCALLPEDGKPSRDNHLTISGDGLSGSLGSAWLDATATGFAPHLLGTEDSVLHETADGAIFFDVFRPPARLVVIGAGEDARPLVRLAVEMGFRVHVVDRRPALLSAERFPADARLVLSRAPELARRVALDERCHAIVMTHQYQDDLEYLRELVEAPVAYIGLLGPRQRTERLLAALSSEGSADTSRIYGPVGLDLGAEGAEQVALSVIAEVLALNAGRTASSLRELRRPIHAVAL